MVVPPPIRSTRLEKQCRYPDPPDATALQHTHTCVKSHAGAADGSFEGLLQDGALRSSTEVALPTGAVKAPGLLTSKVIRHRSICWCRHSGTLRPWRSHGSVATPDNPYSIVIFTNCSALTR